MLKILIAEDDRDFRQLFSHGLEKNSYTVQGVGNGQEALDALEGSQSRAENIPGSSARFTVELTSR